MLIQRCTIHKDRNIQRHVAKNTENEFMIYIKRRWHTKQDDALKAFEKLDKVLMDMNVSAARSLREALPELLSQHRLGITGDLYKVLHATNGIEIVFSSVRHRECNIKNYKIQSGSLVKEITKAG